MTGRLAIAILISTIVVVLLHLFSARIFARYRDTPTESLLNNNRWAITVSYALLFVGLLGCLALYELGGFARSDWHPIALGLGFGLSAPLVAIPAITRATGRSTSSAFRAFAASEGMPVGVIYCLFAIGIVLLLMGMSGIWGTKGV